MNELKSSFYITNLDSERRKFLFDPLYNPQFEYENQEDLKKVDRHGTVTDDLLPLAEKIIERVIKKYGEEEVFQAQEGELLSREATDKIIHNYINNSSALQKKVKVLYSPRFTARTSVLYENEQNLLRIRLPIEYRENALVSVLHHEVGTHIFRRINEEQQPWRGQHKDYELHPYMQTEEGLAVLNSMVAHQDPHLWAAALNYYAAYHAQFLSFSKLSQALKPFVPDVNRRWKICVRVKRGIEDTSEPGANTKDQIYLKGVVKVGHWLVDHHFDVAPLYMGKIDCVDIEKLQEMVPEYVPILPEFTQELSYKKKLQSILSLNKILS